VGLGSLGAGRSEREGRGAEHCSGKSEMTHVRFSLRFSRRCRGDRE
jgi:hypothetical protein